MIKLIRTTRDDPHFLKLVEALDQELAVVDGEDHAFYSQYNTLGQLGWTVVAYQNGLPVGCGALKKLDTNTVEIKRMFVDQHSRSEGVASQILHELEQWARELGFTTCVLETGKRLPAAVNLYQKRGYQPTENYGQYIGVENSLCFKKLL